MIAIDPGPEKSAWLVYDEGKLGDMGIENNEGVLHRLYKCANSLDASYWPVVVEWIETFGMSVGKDVFETVYWVGRFSEAVSGCEERITRRQVKKTLCGQMKAKDSEIRQALIDRFGGIGGKEAAVGNKKKPGPLYGVKTHLWSALAVAVTDEEINE